MSRPTYTKVDAAALRHNVAQIKKYAPHSKIIAMVKANAYGCGLAFVVPQLEGQVDAYGVAYLEEALALRALGSRSDCILFQGVYQPQEWPLLVQYHLQAVIHQERQLEWLLSTPLNGKVKIWVKVNTGMHRLGFAPEKIAEIFQSLKACPWVAADFGLITHLASADEPQNPSNLLQLDCFQSLSLPPDLSLLKSMANSAAIICFPQMHFDVVRPGIMLYGASPFSNVSAQALGLKPVIHFFSALSAIHRYPPFAKVGYGGTWQSKKASIIGVVAVGYGDGYPRHIHQGFVHIKGKPIPIVGRVSMDTLTVDLTEAASQENIKEGEPVELWGATLPIEKVAAFAGTIPYELLCQSSLRVPKDYLPANKAMSCPI